MRIAILGTGRVAQTLATGLLRAGHDVVIGSRDPENRAGLPAPVLSSVDAVVGADVVVNAVQGVDTLPLLASIGPGTLEGTVLWDLSNAATPDFSLAMPDDSVGRQIQEALPGVKVVKAGNNVAAVVTADPDHAAGSDDAVPLRRRQRREGGRLRPAHRSRMAAREPARPRRHRQRVWPGALPGAVRIDAAAARHAVLQHRRRQGLVSVPSAWQLRLVRATARTCRSSELRPIRRREW